MDGAVTLPPLLEGLSSPWQGLRSAVIAHVNSPNWHSAIDGNRCPPLLARTVMHSPARLIMPSAVQHPGNFLGYHGN